MTCDIYALGNALVDTELETQAKDLDQLEIQKGIMTLVDEERLKHLARFFTAHTQQKACGGSAANTLIGAAQLGATCFYSCKVADDDIGRFYLSDLKANGVQTNLKPETLDNGKSGQCMVMVTPDADRTMNTFLGISSELSEKELDIEALQHARFLYLEGYLVTSPSAFKAMCKAAEYANAHHTNIALTLSDPFLVEHFKPQIDTLMDYGISLLFCNEEEALVYTQSDTIEEAMDALSQKVDSFAITQGKEGSVIYDGDEIIDIPPTAVEAIDTNGAGDAYAAGFLAELIRGTDYAQAGRLASFMSAQVVTQFGPRLSDSDYTKVKAYSN